MPTLKRNNWPLGYTPGANEYNGDNNGLLIADNLTFDETGVVRLSKGTALESSGPFSGNGEAIYSTVFDLKELISSSFPDRAKVRYVGDSNGLVLRNYGPTNKSLRDYEIGVMNAAAGSNGVYAFGSAFGHTILCSGTAKFKDRGDIQGKLGIARSNVAPFITANVPPTVRADDPDASNLYTKWDAAAVEGTLYDKSHDYILVKTAALENFSRAIIQRGTLTTTTLDLAQMAPAGRGTSEDLFTFNLRLQYSDYFIKVRVEYLLGMGGVISNYFWHEWTNRIPAETETSTNAFDFIPADMSQEQIDSLATTNPGISFVSSIREGRDTWTPLICKRGDFNRVGTDDALGWATVKGIRITYYSTQDMEILFNEARFIGGDQGQLTGEFTYIQQDFRDTNSFIEWGIPSPETAPIQAYGTSINVTPNALDQQANGFRIYRLSNATDGFYVVKQREKVRINAWTNANPSVITSPNHGLISGNLISVRDGYGAWFYATGVFSITVLDANRFQVVADTTTYGPKLGDINYVNITPFNDSMSDAEALFGGSNNRLDRNKSLLPDDIIGMVAPYFGRVIYLTTKVIVPSEQYDPSRYDTRFSIENAADTGEVNLFITQISERFILIGTTKGFYSLSGDGTVVDDIINFKLDTMGVEQPPISMTYEVYNSVLYYYAADGIRYIEGSQSGLLTIPMRLQFPPWNETRFNHPPYRILPSNGVKTSFVTVGGKLYAAMDQGSYGRTVLIYDFLFKRFEYRRNQTAANNPFALFVEEDGTILFTTAGDGDRYLHQLETGKSYNGDTIDQAINFLTIYDNDNLQNNRKDPLTLFVDAETGSNTIVFSLYGLRDDGSVETLNFSNAIIGRHRIALDVSSMQPKKAYAFAINGSVSIFKLYEISLEYATRPTQVNFLRLPPNNWGIAGRKRVPEIPMLIDTIGNSVTFTPVLDGVAQTAVAFTKTDKDVYHHIFNEDHAAYVIGGTLKATTPGAVFEFYDLITPREIEQLPDPLSYKRIPATNLGNASRKRFIQFAFVINTNGFNVTFAPLIDGLVFATMQVNTIRKQTVIYTFADSSAVGIDIEGILDSNIDNQKFEYYGVDLNESISEKLPPITKFYQIPCTNLGTTARKRFIQYAFEIDTKGADVTFQPRIDGVAYPSSTVNTSRKQTYIYTFTPDAPGVDVCGTLTATTTPFEFYDVDLKQSVSETLPPIANYTHIPYSNLGKASRKRIIQFAFVIDTRGANVTFTPKIDATDYPTLIVNTSKKQTVIYTFPANTVGVDIGGSLISVTGAFEYYGLNMDECISEKLPPITRFMHIPFNNLGTTSRKRIQQFGIVIDTLGQPVTLIPAVDNTNHSALTITTYKKQTVIYTFMPEVTGVDIAGAIQSNTATPFEFYGVSLEDAVYEKLPPIAEFRHIAFNNFGTTARKRFQQIGLIIDTKGKDVYYTPSIDGVAQTRVTINTNRKQTFIHTFTSEAIGVDIGGTLDSVINGETFEFYSLSMEDSIYEKLPPIAKYYRVPCNNFGSNGVKRVRTLPFTINTNGHQVKFTPIVDGTTYPFSLHTTVEKRTVFHFFETDVFGIDYCGYIEGTEPFEFYGMGKPESVENLPTAKLFDQIGPVELKRFGRIYKARVRIVPTGSSLTYRLTVDNVLTEEGTWQTAPNLEQILEITFPKFVSGQLAKLELQSTSPFHRLTAELLVRLSGNDTDNRWMSFEKYQAPN